MSDAILVRDIHGPAELRACQALQRRTWGITEDGYVVPVATMAAAQKVGGLVLGAFNADNALVGFTFAFLGRLRDRLVLYSQLAAVDPVAQGQGIGRLLKLEQRSRAKALDLDAVVWAFDPLRPATPASTWVCWAQSVAYMRSTCTARALMRSTPGWPRIACSPSGPPAASPSPCASRGPTHPTWSR
ncbi:MAG TPA: hypothetical protein VGL99_18435 [Chloroflexota bacterium]